MKILSVRQSFEADHSSSTYEFFALDWLTPEQRIAVQSLTGESGHRHLRFHYWGDWGSLPSGWRNKLLALGYDIMVSESYDWWAVYLSLPASQVPPGEHRGEVPFGKYGDSAGHAQRRPIRR